MFSLQSEKVTELERKESVGRAGLAGQQWGGVGVQRGDYYGLGEINRVGFEQ